MRCDIDQAEQLRRSRGDNVKNEDMPAMILNESTGELKRRLRALGKIGRMQHDFCGKHGA